MKNLIIMAAVLCCSFQIGWAQKAARSDNKEMREIRQEMLREAAQAKAQAGARGDAPTPGGDLGEPDSFGKNALFLGTVSTGVILVDPDCDPATIATLGPDGRCIHVLDPALATVGDFPDLGRITIPGKTVSNVVYMINNHNTSWTFHNSSASNASAQMTYAPTITIESDALNDPAAIDPNTGNQMNGSYTTTGNGTKSMVETLFPNYSATHLESYSRANTVGLSRTFFAGLGLPTSIINQLYKKPMTIRLGVRITVRYVPSGVFLYSARLLGN